MAERVAIYVLDRFGDTTAILDQAIRFSATQRWQDLGSVAATIRGTDAGASELARGASLAIMVDEVVFASGPLKSLLTTTGPKGEEIEASGPDDLAWIDGKIGYPAAPSINPNAAVSSDISGPAEDVIYGYVDRNAGPGAITARQHVRLAPSGHRGSTVNESVRFDNVLDVARRVAIVDGFGYSCRWDPALRGRPLFTVETSRDLRAEIQFSVPRGTLGQSVSTDIAPGATHVLVGGDGTGVGRVFAQVDDDATAAEWFRVETFVDASGISDVATLTQRALSGLQQAGRTVTLTAVETEGMRYGRDWKLGDIVTGIAGNFSDVFVVVQVQIAGPPLRIVPTLAQFAGYRLGELATVQQRVLAMRVRSLETN